MDFYERVRFVVNHIPYGKAATYGQIALLCGKPRNSRQVGYALNRHVVSVHVGPLHVGLLHVACIWGKRICLHTVW